MCENKNSRLSLSKYIWAVCVSYFIPEVLVGHPVQQLCSQIVSHADNYIWIPFPMPRSCFRSVLLYVDFTYFCVILTYFDSFAEDFNSFREVKKAAFVVLVLVL